MKPPKLKLVTFRELFLLLVCIAVTYLLRFQETYSLVPAWRWEIDTSVYENSQYAVYDWERGLPPQVTDLDGDGKSEIIFVKGKSSVIVAEVPESNRTSKVLPPLKIKHQATLGDQGPLQLVSIATGYLKGDTKKQVVVAVTADWTAICFSHKLEVLWRKKLLEVEDHFYFSELAVLVSDQELKRGDRGLVIIGGRLAKKDHHHKMSLGHDHQRVEDISPLLADLDDDDGAGGNEEEEQLFDEERQRGLGHFSTFALEASNGSVRWHHLPGDFDEKTFSKSLFGAYHFKLGLSRGRTHRSEVHWSFYSQSIAKTLPHKWERKDDTRARLFHFEKNQHGKPPQQEGPDSLLQVLGVTGDSSLGSWFGPPAPHPAPSKSPNVVVINSQEGVEVLKLKTGEPLCRVALGGPSGAHRSSYADVDGDGGLDQVTAHFSQNAVSQDHCQAVVRSASPPYSSLYNGSICFSFKLFQFLKDFLTDVRAQIYEDASHSVAPLAIKSVGQPRGVLQHLSGQSLKPFSGRGMDTLFLVSNGVMSSYSPTGHLNWQTETAAGWLQIAYAVAANQRHNPQLSRHYQHSFVASMTTTTIGQSQASAEEEEEEGLVALGWDQVSLVSLKDGQLLAQHPVPCPGPAAPITKARFHGDGWPRPGFIIQCPDMYVGFWLKREQSYWATLWLGAAIILTVIGLTALCTLDNSRHRSKHHR